MAADGGPYISLIIFIIIKTKTKGENNYVFCT